MALWDGDKFEREKKNFIFLSFKCHFPIVQVSLHIYRTHRHTTAALILMVLLSGGVFKRYREELLIGTNIAR